jgi:hypothetical protein
VAVLCACLVVAGVTTFRAHDDGGSDVAIKDATVLPTDAPDGVAAPPGVATGATPGEKGRAPSPSNHRGNDQTGTVGGTRTQVTAPASRARTTHRPVPRSSKPKSTPTRPTTGVRRTSAKKGAALWATPRISSALTDSGVSWFYNWSQTAGGVSAPGVEFVPMMWGSASVTAANLATARAGGKVLLGFNEPDMASQSNLTVEAALSLWPQLQGTGMRLGSPAVAWGAGDANGWLDRFMTGAQQKGYRVDFITLHWYGSDFRSAAATDQLRSYVTSVWNRYHKPIWITEYALMNFGSGPKLPSAAVQADFVKQSTAMLQGLSYVERYAWFAFPTSTDGTDGTGLYRNGTATVPGLAYRAAG